MSNRFAISSATVVMLVLLRLNIGWHFFSEGVKHYTDPHWTSEPVLARRQRPTGLLYHGYLPDFHGFEQTAARRAEPKRIARRANLARLDPGRLEQPIASSSPTLRTERSSTAARPKRRWRSFRPGCATGRSANKESLVTHVHEWRRKKTGTASCRPATCRFKRSEIAEKQALLAGEAAGWLAEMKSHRERTIKTP